MSFLDDIFRGYFPHRQTPEDYQRFIGSLIGDPSAGAMPSPQGPTQSGGVTPPMPGQGGAMVPGALPGLAPFGDALKNLPPAIGTKFLLDQIGTAVSPEQQQLVRGLQMRKQIGDILSSQQGAAPDPNAPTLPITSTNLPSVAAGTQNHGISPDLLRSLAIKAYTGGGNPADVTALMNIGKGEQFDLAKGEKRFDTSGNVIASNDEKKIIFVNGQAVDESTGLPLPGVEPIPQEGQGAVSPERQQQLLDIAKARGTQAGNVQSVQQAADGSLIVVHRDGKIEHMNLDGGPVKGTQTPEAVFNRFAAQSSGKAAGTAAEALPTTTANFDIINKTLDAFDEPAVKSQASAAVGFGGFLPTIPGVNSDFKARADQLKGQAFLQAFNTLRGGGQITEVEGAKATDAIARMNKAQTPDEFYKALADAKVTFKTLFDAAKTRAARGQVVPATQNGAAAPAGAAPKIIQYDAQGKRIQ